MKKIWISTFYFCVPPFLSPYFFQPIEKNFSCHHRRFEIPRRPNNEGVHHLKRPHHSLFCSYWVGSTIRIQIPPFLAAKNGFFSSEEELCFLHFFLLKCLHFLFFSTQVSSTHWKAWNNHPCWPSLLFRRCSVENLRPFAHHSIIKDVLLRLLLRWICCPAKEIS